MPLLASGGLQYHPAVTSHRRAHGDPCVMKVCTAFLVLALLASPAPAPLGQEKASSETSSAPPAAATSTFSAEQLEQLVAPIALYPDSLLAQVLMAATYPLEVVEAARWTQKNPKLKGDALETALQKETWDPAVKSLCGFADVLKRMSDNLDWTQDLGDATLGQQAELMAAVQRMRRKALDAGNLKSSKELEVSEEGQIIVIEAADPEVIYVPTYYPSVVYGSWSYPYWYYPPLYPPPPAGGAWFGFSVGIFWGAAIWGDCDWGHTEIDIDVDHHHEFVDRTESADRRQQVKDKAASRDRSGNRAGWQHDPSHRKGVGYKDDRTAERFGGGPGQTRVSRDQARGYSPGSTGGLRDASAGSRPSASTRPSPSRSVSTTGQRSSAFSGSRSPSLDRAGSSRGSMSRSSFGSRGGGRGGRGRR